MLLAKSDERECFLVSLYFAVKFIVSLNVTIANHENEDWINGAKTEDVVAFLDRLYTAKRKVEQRIVVLGGGEDDSIQDPIQTPRLPTGRGVGTVTRLTLRDVLRKTRYI